ncbi:RNA polymerase sigma-70 factor [Mucilaginibacter sp. UC70_90]
MLRLSMNETNIQDLLQKIAFEDDQQAFRVLYFQYYKRLYNLASFYVRSAEATEEVVNDTFISIWSRRKLLTGITDFTSYIYKAVKNKSLNFLKQKNFPIHFNIDDIKAEIEDVTLNIEDQMIVADFQLLIEHAVNNLPAQCRLVFKMIKEDGLPHKEVAELLNLSVRTIEYHMSIALKKLSESLNYKKNAPLVSSK